MMLWRFAAIFFAATTCLAAEHPAEVFFSKYCLECHDSDVQKGDRSFEELFFPIGKARELIEVQDIIDQLNLGEMPPKKADQPTEAEVAEVIGLLTKEVETAHEKMKSSGGQTVLRRLNEREYLNTLESLFLRRVDTLAPTQNFSNDQTYENIDTIGDTLVTSSFLLHNYFEAADLVVENSLGTAKKPEVKEWHFDKNFTQGQELSFSHKRVYNFRYLCLYEVPNTVNHEGGYGGLEKFQEGVHAPGYYEVKVRAHSMNRDSHYDREIFQMDLKEPFRLGVVTGDATAGALHHPQPIEPRLAEVTVADGEPQWYTMKVWLEKGQQPRFIFPNGMANCRNAFSRIASKYKKEWPEGDPYLKKAGIVESRRVVLEHGKMPHIRIHEVKIRGPVYEEWPPEPQRSILGAGNFGEPHRRKILKEFASRAYRRPPEMDEVDRLLAIAESRIADGHSPRQATLDAIKAALCSPAFIYFSEPGKGKSGELLGAHDLASRLSYFLWAAPPDQQLRALADSGELLKTGVLKEQFQRLVKDPRAEEFFKGFTDSWLNLRSLGGMPPSRSEAAVYFYDDLETAMKREVQVFTQNLVETNGSILNFIDSDYSFLNHSLANLYKEPFDFPIDQREQFHKVKFTSKKRGGLLGMGAVLTVSANGIETSPVTRGVYLLENIIGTPTPPPPDEVPALEPDTRGSTTIRDELIKHRQVKTCAECHRKIDPPGFALENYDPIGRWRSRYPGNRKKPGPEIDSTGEFPDGTTFSGVHDFRKQLLERKGPFARHLTESLLGYATGRHIDSLDRPVVDKIVAACRADGYGMETLLKAVVTSEIFRSR
ncbi:MAG: DUF1592 domain-containing protein [Verrucomicrobiales bacterium]|nr:DUF1592 domain-containing protein [Verrucomicrobiales bacterium]